MQELKWSKEAPKEAGQYLVYNGKCVFCVFWEEKVICEWAERYAKIYEDEKWLSIKDLLEQVK